ncbi:MAG: hypothetical protein CM15mP50_0010 [Rhodobacterales bacterium]|nr:MAG: hypothetical protein CM15mP50_0010 [Rhodobacterales bacterium]
MIWIIIRFNNVAALCAALDLVVTTKITVLSISAAVGTKLSLLIGDRAPGTIF